MIKPRSKKALYIGLPLALAISAAAAYLTWDYWPNPGYSLKVMKQADELQDRIISFDSHITVPLTFGAEGREADKDGSGQFDLVKTARGRLSGAALTVFGWPEIWNGPNAPHRPTAGFVDEARKQQEVRYKIITGMVRDFPNQVGIAYTPDDMRRLHGEGKFAIFISMLNAYPLGHDLDLLDTWTARGMRMFGFSYVGNNDWADSSRPLPFLNDTPDALDGLSDIGKQAVHRLNDLGVIIDVSQMSTKGLEQVSQLSRTPMVASHSAPRALVDIPRNLSDKEMQLIKNSGGVVQIVAFPAYLRPLSQPTQDKLNALRKRFDLPPLPNLAMALMPGDPIITVWPEQRFGEYASALYAILDQEPKADLKDFGNAIDYAVKKIGIDHVGISSDFNDGGGIDGFKDVGEARNVTAELLERGYSEADIAKLWGGNFLRVWDEVQKAARR
ncbi:pyoverdine-tailoring dipeptidase-like protein PvdM [Pseudomonas gingeri]|uniref:pyoverdine-tailoring dipeptidase-like protein PvdM n=1 Tax=Pseudomonas gingeri TaxID=117681 RepID=UPI0015A2FC19|nr:pyoverdine-tailoring dipeptidase-like protein PvdM [Pseudomonas gingeri]NWD08941.1 pyoverdine-tailoring dipeptidase-like protein PvdM [Pseudomonas gingeri]NWD47126.1 pyoverdine-tailoring dipeptidase-like protein PvdM [Pseudomonas gingeri]NWE36181.1 pyoverdine-tailoring dipeptidase-like protein PvdM [Pseudomonas gingeri]NWE60379.1 pyoverdine-tailoring dipeptidase-like protein PvdM [Pseudomonas gingeri]NWF05883.1 pyoverdine-tailoring dipeptidase-like protein PvdM [Pseudomonas gingeri]